MNILDYFHNTKNSFPDKIALEDENGTLTFSELNQITDHIAARIISLTSDVNKPIVVFMPKNRWAISCFIAIIKTRNFYVPIDIKSPLDRITKILETLEPSIIITDTEHEGLLRSLNSRAEIISITKAEIQQVDLTILKKLIQIKNEIIDLDPIYSIFTSGSTGIPKGVLISHRGVVDYINWARSTFNISEFEVIGNQAPLYFDNSTLDIYLMIFTGAKLILVPEKHFSFPIQLLQYLETKQINFVFWVPSVLINLANTNVLEKHSIKSLKKILFAGEVMPNKQLNYWRKNLPNILYANLYGPTEITVDCTFFVVDRDFKDDEPLPIGIPCKNSEILIISENNQLVLKNEIGELCVRGSSLALGYYRDGEKTKDAFIQNPLHNDYVDIIYKTGDLVQYNDRGEILFMGRKDSQIKHNGYRIELGEIESIIMSLPAIQNVCVLYDEELKQIKAFYSGDSEITALRKALTKMLPKYMIPTKWKKLKSFPLNTSGKIDRKKLKNLNEEF